jgi:poly [ADP-ribose] polymerase 2/3/4
VGERGENKLEPHGSLASATKSFEAKFRDKTSNAWAARGSFKAVPGKYTLIEVEKDTSEAAKIAARALTVPSGGAAGGGGAGGGSVALVTMPASHRPCALPARVFDLVSLLFDIKTFTHAMTELKVDVKKMPLGALSRAQLTKGYSVLDRLERALRAANVFTEAAVPGSVKKSTRLYDELSSLSSEFYTVIPHSFGRERPPVIDTKRHFDQKVEMLNTLSDVEVAQGMLQVQSTTVDLSGLPEHPADGHYRSLACDVVPVDRASEEWKMLQTYLLATSPAVRPAMTIVDVFRIDRHDHKARFAAHKGLPNHKLLWHGTNVAVVPAILRTGLRIMPHSGGRVGRGLYFASQSEKSWNYVRRAANNTGILFLTEVALGREEPVTVEQWNYTAAPPGYDSVHAMGRIEPNPALDASTSFDGVKVTVPLGAPISMPPYAHSNFHHSEYLVYSESQARLRYLIMFK